MQQIRRIIFSEHFRPGSDRAIARHLVVFDLLGRSDESGIKDHVLAVVLHDLGAFLDESLHAVACFSGGFLIQLLKDFIKPRHMFLGLFEMIFKRLFQFGRRSRFCHLRQRL